MYVTRYATPTSGWVQGITLSPQEGALFLERSLAAGLPVHSAPFMGASTQQKKGKRKLFQGFPGKESGCRLVPAGRTPLFPGREQARHPFGKLAARVLEASPWR